jgi:signal transduction histidine kinase
MLVEGHESGRRVEALPRPPWARYAYAVLAACAATSARLILGVYFGYEHRFAMLYIAVLLSSWYGGLGPAVAAAALGGLSAALFDVEPGRVVAGFAKTNLAGLEFYCMVSVTVVILFEAERRTRRRAIEAEEQLREAQKLESIGLLAGGIAHDFNNILTGVLGNASLARELVPADSRAQGLLAAIIGASERAAQLTGQLLAYAGKANFVRAAVDFSEMVRQAIDSVRPDAPAAIEFRLDLAEGLPPVMTDPAQIQQLIAGLAMNAVEAIGERAGTVTVRTRLQYLEIGTPAAVGKIEDGEYVCLSVEDTGCGMDEAIEQRIFDPFFTTKFMGRGLGLAAVAGIARALDGAVMVWSEVGRGTKVEVAVPSRERRNSLERH